MMGRHRYSYAPDDDRLLRQARALRHFFGRRVDAADVDDLVQNVFVSIQGRLSASPIENFEAYLFTVARHELARYYKRRAKNKDYIDSIFIEEKEDDSPDAEKTLMSRDDLNHILQAIEDLPLRTRSVFIMHRFEDKSYDSIGRMLGISKKGVEYHISAALKALAIAKAGLECP